MKEQYGSDAKKVFYASKNKGVIKNVEKKMGGGLSGGKRFGPPPEKGPNPQGLKVKKAFMGLAVEALSNSQSARDFVGNFGLAGKAAKNYFDKEEKEDIEKIEIIMYYMKSPKLPVGPVGKFRLLGGAAPLSS